MRKMRKEMVVHHFMTTICNSCDSHSKCSPTLVHLYAHTMSVVNSRHGASTACPLLHPALPVVLRCVRNAMAASMYHRRTVPSQLPVRSRLGYLDGDWGDAAWGDREGRASPPVERMRVIGQEQSMHIPGCLADSNMYLVNMHQGYLVAAIVCS